MANQVSTNYQEILNTLNSMDSSRQDMLNAISLINKQIDNTTNWQGEDAKVHKEAIKDLLQKMWNSAKWMDEVTSKLKIQAEIMNNNSEEAAANAKFFQVGG